VFRLDKMRGILAIFLMTFLLTITSATNTGTFTIENPNFCGDSRIGGLEECDLSDLGGITCISLGYNSGKINCTGECTLDESFCVVNFNISSSSEVVGSSGGSLNISGTKNFQEGSSTGNASNSVEFFVIRECNDGLDNDGDGEIDSGRDSGCSNILDNSEKNTVCDSNWEEESWSECIADVQERRIIDLNHCKSDYIQTEAQQCYSVEEEKKVNTIVYEEVAESLKLYSEIENSILIFVIAFSLVGTYFLIREVLNIKKK